MNAEEMRVFQIKAESACLDLVRKHQIEIEELTEAQTAEALKQSIACGDFTKYVRSDNRAQTVIYIPFQMQHQLECRIKLLEEIITARIGPIRDVITQHETVL